jgi:hypothetical protein
MACIGTTLHLSYQGDFPVLVLFSETDTRISRKNKIRNTIIKQKINTLWSLLDDINTSKAELNTICHFLALLGAHHILHVSRIRVNNNFRVDPDLEAKNFNLHPHLQLQLFPLMYFLQILT